MVWEETAEDDAYRYILKIQYFRVKKSTYIKFYGFINLHGTMFYFKWFIPCFPVWKVVSLSIGPLCLIWWKKTFCCTVLLSKYSILCSSVSVYDEICSYKSTDKHGKHAKSFKTKAYFTDDFTCRFVCLILMWLIIIIQWPLRRLDPNEFLLFTSSLT